MDSRELIVVNGQRPISGTVEVRGAKNSVLKLMAASVMASGETCIGNVPFISDVDVMSDVLSTIGARVRRGDDSHTLFIDTRDLNSYRTPYELVAKMRASISILGPLITRFGCAVVAMPGGCQIGSRKLDMHIASLEALGVQFDVDHGYLHASTPNGLIGAEVILDFQSVGATENLMMASVCARGTTVIHNAACEPEIVDLANFLISMGADIENAGTPDVVVHGVTELHPTSHMTVGDRIEAGTFLVAGAATGGPVTVRGASPDHLGLALKKLHQMGVDLFITDDEITAERSDDLRPADIQTLPFPGFPTDLQAQFMVLCALANGDSIITENLFENRFMFAAELARMGADIRIDGHHALVNGVGHLSGAPVNSTDLRAGAALVIAGLVADGATFVDSIHHIDRGYEDYVGKLRALGADIERVPAQDLSF